DLVAGGGALIFNIALSERAHASSGIASLLVFVLFFALLIRFIVKGKSKIALGFVLGVVLIPLVVLGLVFGTCLVMLSGSQGF
ncbi:MAG TPA: hypothetical protein PKI32_08460, partial [Opitutales bacterium]|nr:hypothetical protein [Opitutales bacterium]